jgi:transposase InsO family protein
VWRNDEPLRKQLIELPREKVRFGYCRLHVLLQRDGQRVNHKRVYRVYREAGLMVRRKARKRLMRAGPLRPALTAANQEWALDFVHDAVECYPPPSNLVIRMSYDQLRGKGGQVTRRAGHCLSWVPY